MEERTELEGMKIGRLVAGYIKEDLTLDERKELNGWIHSDPQNAALFEQLINENNIEKAIDLLHQFDPQAALANIKRKMHTPERRKTGSGIKWIAAASIIIILIIGAVFYMKPQNREIPKGTNNTLLTEDIPPGGKKAILITGTGKTLDLSVLKDSSVEVGENIMAENKNNTLSYRGRTGASSINILKTPVGGEYQLSLSDGTKIWLNAASVIKYPTIFNDNKREIELDGEAYFEVAQDVRRPFSVRIMQTPSFSFKETVKGGEMEIEVLGTSFNVSSYRNDKNKKVTLLEGFVKVKTGNQSKKIDPGQQVNIDSNKEISLIDHANIEEAIAWKNGLFSFNKSDINEVMAQIARWYDITFEIKGNIRQELTGKIYRHSTLSQVLRMIEISGNLKVEQKGRIVIIRP